MSRWMRRLVGQEAGAVALVLALSGCAAFEPPPSKTAAELLAAGEPGAALDAAVQDSKLDQGTRERVARAAIAVAGPMVTVDVIPQEELRKYVGIHLLRAVDPSWVFLRVHGSARSAGFSAVEARVQVTSGGKELLVLGNDAKSLTVLTGETYPRDIEHTKFTTGDFPWPLHALTFGVLTVLTARVETTYTQPPEEVVRAAVPRALLLQKALAGSCTEGPCEQRIVLRRPQREDAPLSLDVVVNVSRRSGAVVSAVATVPVPEGGRLEERLARAATKLAVADLANARVAIFPAEVKDGPHCDRNDLVRIGVPYCAPSAPWPTDEITPIGLELPQVPERLGTPKESLAARPPWATDDDYAPKPKRAFLDESLPVAAQVEGGVLACDTDAFSIPGDDADRVSANVTIDRRTFRVGGTAFALPLVTLGPKSKVDVSFDDWDWLSGNDLLAIVPLKREGATMAGSVGSASRPSRVHVSVKCHIFDRGAVEAGFAKAWYRAEDALDACVESPVVVHPEASDFGRSGSPLLEAQRRVSDAAAFVGWSDPRVARLVSRWDEQDRRFWSGVRRAIEGLKKDASGRVVLERSEPGEGKVHGVAVRCGEAVKREIEAMGKAAAARYDAAYLPNICAVDIDVENLDKYPKYPGSFLDKSQIVLDDGHAIDVAILGGGVIAPGARAKLTLVPKGTPPASSRAAKPWRLVVRGFRWTEIVVLSPP
ncbi:hypothetical protein [Polyangium aurulentum]|uniref:hypothetical protein n=1 Tax=Polyangium aurulentum TaxID=2567896 RepID=UPI0010AE3408|nr:hypothetical protein [Polyangium aurulentum]UQA62789.1 hypothetical protein E8A73_020995 [Polyangium aurulentum]